ncbi:MAG: hypothetical protein ABIT71_10730 [Vicinamibacteraceae bacterium]
MSLSKPKSPASFPSVGDRVQHHQYGVGSVTMLDVYHTVIDFDGHGIRRFVTNKIVVERTDDPGPTASERRAIVARRAKEERARVKAAGLVEKVPVPSRRRRTKPDPEDAPVETLA